MALTATITQSALKDAQKSLSVKDCRVFQQSFNRPNLVFEVRDKPPKYLDALNFLVDEIQSQCKGQSGIVYCMTKNESEEVSNFLTHHGVKCDYYHAGEFVTIIFRHVLMMCSLT
jgi:superfamily II DNA helicase RecQ